MSFRSVLAKIEADITIGIKAAEPIVAEFDPAIALILSSIANGLAILEKKKVNPSTVSSFTQAITTVCTVMQHAGVCTGDKNCTACCCPAKETTCHE